MDTVSASRRASRSAFGRRPPSADPHGAELSTGAVLLILFAMTVLTYVLTWTAPLGRGPMEDARSLIVIEGMRVALWLCILGFLGWLRVGGLAPGSTSSWGIVPLVAFSLAALVTVGLRDVVPYGAGYLVFVLMDCLGAVREELAFRGFLLLGLTRRLGGPAAILTGSMLFAAYHVPRYLVEQRPPGEMAALLLVAFGVGVFLCRVRLETGSIWFPVAIHGLWNVFVGVGLWAFPQGDLPGAYVALHTAPVVLGVLMALVLAMPQLSRFGLSPLLPERVAGRSTRGAGSQSVARAS
jgi:membrane protease YdiL (CAAX protease family)